MFEVIFLVVLSLAWIIFAVIQDLKSREIANWLNFSLIIFAIGFRFFYSLFSEDFNFLYQGLIGLGIFFILGNVLYYGRMFAGGDAKLLVALGAVLPLSSNILSNLENFFMFFLIFLSVGSFYTIATSTFFCLKNLRAFKKEFAAQFRQKKKMILIMMFFGLSLMALGFMNYLFFYLGILIFFTYYLYLYAKAVDEACMIKKTNTKKLTEGDWLYSDLNIGKRIIRATWEGLTRRNITDIRKKYSFVRIRQGIPFSPVFLLGFIIFAVIKILGIELWNPFW